MAEALQLAVIDPALGKTGAHNRGFVETLLAQRGPELQLALCCHHELEPALQATLAQGPMTVHPVFDGDFYQLLHRTGGVAEHWDWLHALAHGYLRAFERLLQQWPQGRIHLLYHTLSWEHASALALAITLLGGRGQRLRHIALLMYWPGLDPQGRVLDGPRSRNFQQAFLALERCPGVRLYASCSEYAQAYAQLLARPEPLPLHPCFLGDWRRAPTRAAALPARRVLAYLGEVKGDKGFLALPQRLATLLRHNPSQVQYVVQCVQVRNEAGAAVLAQLQALAAQYPQLELHHGFWSDAELHDQLQRCDALYLHYDPQLYAHKTSGLLWLAAWYRRSLWLPAGSWLQREARRLGLRHASGGDPLRLERAKVHRRDCQPAYFAQLFTPFCDWLCGQMRADAPEPKPEPAVLTDVPEQALIQLRQLAAAPRLRAAPAAGASVVVFWKQNDGDLYGRRCDMVIDYLASRDDVARVLVVEAPLDPPALQRLLAGREALTQQGLVLALLQDKLGGRRDRGKVGWRCFVHDQPGAVLPPGSPEAAGFDAAYADFLQAVLAQEGIDPSRALFWVYPRNYRVPALLARLQPARTVIDVVDDDRSWPGVDVATRSQLSEHYRQLLADADLVLANCVPVQQALAEYRRDIVLVPNGCDADPPREPPADSAGYGRLCAHKGPVLGFVGNLESKIDLPLLDLLAQRFPQALLVLAGSTHANPAVRALRRHPNVLMPGVLPYAQLGAWVSRFDVGLVPHLDTVLTRHMNPLKPFVYLAWQVPVVATGVRNLDAGTALIRIAPDHAGFLQAVAERLQEPRPPAEAFRRYVADNDWATRLRAVVDRLELARL